MKVVALVQARLGSIRFPGKVLKLIKGKPMIELLLKRLSTSKEIDEIIVASSEEIDNDKLQLFVESLGYKCTRGKELDVLKRFYESAKETEADIIVRITGDCPLVDSSLVDDCIRSYKNANVDYFSNTNPPTYPDGLDVEVFSFQSLKTANEEAFLDYEREHVTPYIINSKKFLKSSLQFDSDLSSLRWTVDEQEDFAVISKVFDHFYPDLLFGWKDVLKLSEDLPDIFTDNKDIINYEGLNMGIGQKLYKRAKRTIPGGNMYLSKRPEMFLPNQWPSYFSKSQGCKVWDLDGAEYIDMSIMGIGTNILGYGLAPKHYKEIIGKTTSQKILLGTAVSWDHIVK